MTKPAGWVYVLESPLNPDMVRIGQTNDLGRRLKEHNSGRPKNDHLSYIQTYPVTNPKRAESKIHRYYMDYRDRGTEWFHIDFDQEQHKINELCKPFQTEDIEKINVTRLGSLSVIGNHRSFLHGFSKAVWLSGKQQQKVSIDLLNESTWENAMKPVIDNVAKSNKTTADKEWEIKTRRKVKFWLFSVVKNMIEHNLRILKRNRDFYAKSYKGSQDLPEWHDNYKQWEEREVTWDLDLNIDKESLIWKDGHSFWKDLLDDRRIHEFNTLLKKVDYDNFYKKHLQGRWSDTYDMSEELLRTEWRLDNVVVFLLKELETKMYNIEVDQHNKRLEVEERRRRDESNGKILVFLYWIGVIGIGITTYVATESANWTFWAVALSFYFLPVLFSLLKD